MGVDRTCDRECIVFVTDRQGEITAKHDERATRRYDSTVVMSINIAVVVKTR